MTWFWTSWSVRSSEQLRASSADGVVDLDVLAEGRLYVSGPGEPGWGVPSSLPSSEKEYGKEWAEKVWGCGTSQKVSWEQ